MAQRPEGLADALLAAHSVQACALRPPAAGRPMFRFAATSVWFEGISRFLRESAEARSSGKRSSAEDGILPTFRRTFAGKPSFNAHAGFMSHEFFFSTPCRPLCAAQDKSLNARQVVRLSRKSVSQGLGLYWQWTAVSPCSTAALRTTNSLLSTLRGPGPVSSGPRRRS